MSIVADLFSDCLSDIGQLGIGQSASPEQFSQCLRFVNRIIQKWNIQRFMVPTVGAQDYNMVAGTQDYTLGPTGATFPGLRPIFVESGQVRLAGTSMYLPLNLLDRTKWGAIRDKGALTSASGLPQDIWVEYNYPNIAFHLWPVPNNPCIVSLATWFQLQQFVTIFDTVNFPDGYEEAIVKNLAVALAPAYDQPVPPNLMAEASGALMQIQKLNAQSMGGALGESQLLNSPNEAMPPGAAPGQGPGGQ